MKKVGTFLDFRTISENRYGNATWRSRSDINKSGGHKKETGYSYPSD